LSRRVLSPSLILSADPGNKHTAPHAMLRYGHIAP
jgi:hypothetical protein